MLNNDRTGDLAAADPLIQRLAGSTPGSAFSGISLPPGIAPGLIFTFDQSGVIQALGGDLAADGASILGSLEDKKLAEILPGHPELARNGLAALQGAKTRVVTSAQGRRWEWHFYPLPGPNRKAARALGVVYDLSFQETLWLQGAVMNAVAALRRTTAIVDMYPAIAGQLREQLEIDRLALVMGSPPESPFQLEYLEEWGDQGRWQMYPITKQLTDPVVIGSLTGGDAGRLRANAGGLDVSGVRGFPLIVQDKLLGALWVERQEPFSPAEKRLARELAEMFASALQRANQHQLTERRLERLSALHGIDQAISGNYNLNLTLQIILRQVLSQLEVDAVDIILIDPDSLEVTATEGKGFRHYQPRTGINSTRHDLAWRVLQRRELVALPDLYRDSPSLLRGRTFALEGFQSYYGIPLVAKGRILGVLEVFHRKPLQVDEEWSDFLRALGTQAAIAMDNAALVENLRRSNLQLDLAYNSTLEGWVRALALRDSCTADHTHRVVERTLKLARGVGIPERELLHIQRGALLHDIGKLAIPDSVLNKKGALTESEWALMRQHPTLARQILEPIEFLRPALPIPTSHHERWDGSGYPEGLRGGKIPLEARVFALVDVWDALSSPRPYREAWQEDRVLQYIRENTGTHFDPGVVEIWEKVFQIPH